jgi:hypothetical protein
LWNGLWHGTISRKSVDVHFPQNGKIGTDENYGFYTSVHHTAPNSPAFELGGRDLQSYSKQWLVMSHGRGSRLILY